MKKEITVTAKTVDEAVEEAAKQLGVAVSDIEYTVLEEPKKGLFGIGAMPAKISASYELSSDMVALEFISRMVKDMGLDVTVNMTDAPSEGKLITIDGDAGGILIGHHGETLDALQYLANLAANRREEGEKRDYLKISVDVEGYRAKREQALRALARRMADRVLKYKKSVMLEPMNPYERRIIHSEIQSVEGVSTNSIGVENNRRIVIFLEGTAPAEEPRKRPSRDRGERKKVQDDIPVFPVEDLY